MRSSISGLLLLVLSQSFAGCSSEPEATIQAWQMVFDSNYLAKDAGIPGALLSVWGSSENDVWMVGGSQEITPTTPATILNWDGTSWHRLILPKVLGTLWWITGGTKDVLWMAGKDGLVVRWDRAKGQFTREAIPSQAQLWGILAFAEDDVWAVGGDLEACNAKLPCGVIWHFDGTYWTAPKDLTADWDKTMWFKVFGRGAKDFFVCGMNGHILHWDGVKWHDEPVADQSLLTGSCSGNLCVAVGGTSPGVIVEHDGTQWTRKTVAGLDPLNGVWVNPDGSAIAVGYSIWRRSTDGVWTNDVEAPLTAAQFHSVYADPTGGVWAVGGDLFGYKTAALAHFGPVAIPAPVTGTH